MNSTRHFSDQSFVSNVDSLLLQSSLYREFLAEREEILRHKWFESEKAGRDIGFETALVSWVVHHRARWRQARRQRQPAEDTPSNHGAAIQPELGAGRLSTI